MTLRAETDISHADWFADTGVDWHIAATQGPAGFEAYLTIRFDSPVSATYRSDDDLMAAVVTVASKHTQTPEDVFFGLWDGWGELADGARQYSMARANWMRDLWVNPSPPRVLPAFDDAVLEGPKVDLQDARHYLLFRGPASDVGQWGANPIDVNVPRALPPASITWPADQAWFIAADVDAEWLCVGGSADLAEALSAEFGSNTEPANYGSIPDLESID